MGSQRNNAPPRSSRDASSDVVIQHSNFLDGHAPLELAMTVLSSAQRNYIEVDL